MKPKRWKGNAAPDCEVNMTPLIDVALVLVVMLMVATPLAFESRIDVRNTSRTGRQAEVEKKTERIEVTVLSGDSVMINRNTVPRSQLMGVLGPLLRDSVDRGVVVACEPGVMHGAFVDVLDQAKLCGATEIAVVER